LNLNVVPDCTGRVLRSFRGSTRGLCRSEVEDGRGLVVDVLVARFCDGSDAPLHVLSVELELSFGDVVVVLLDGLGVV